MEKKGKFCLQWGPVIYLPRRETQRNSAPNPPEIKLSGNLKNYLRENRPSPSLRAPNRELIYQLEW